MVEIAQSQTYTQRTNEQTNKLEIEQMHLYTICFCCVGECGKCALQNDVIMHSMNECEGLKWKKEEEGEKRNKKIANIYSKCNPFHCFV